MPNWMNFCGSTTPRVRNSPSSMNRNPKSSSATATTKCARQQPDQFRCRPRAGFECLIFPHPNQAFSGNEHCGSSLFRHNYFVNPKRSSRRNDVEIRAGFDIAFQCFQETPMVLMLSIEPARIRDLLSGTRLGFSPNIPSHDYVDMFGNTCTRIAARPDLFKFRTDFLSPETGRPQKAAP